MASLPIKPNSAWNVAEVTAYLAATQNPLRLSVMSGKRPLIVPLWFLHDDAGLWCASKRDSFIVRKIRAQHGCGFDISDNTIPYRGVRGQGTVAIVAGDGERVLRQLIDRYLPNPESEFARWLLAGVDQEVAILIEPAWLSAWDFSARMRKLNAVEGDRQPG